jgi:hypothetical protein
MTRKEHENRGVFRAWNDHAEKSRSKFTLGRNALRIKAFHDRQTIQLRFPGDQGMDEKVTYWASVVLSALALLLLVVNVAMVDSNRHLQEEVNQRQATIQRGVTLSQVNESLVQAMAQSAIKDGDSGMRQLLTAQGITLKNNGTAATGKAASKKSEE